MCLETQKEKKKKNTGLPSASPSFYDRVCADVGIGVIVGCKEKNPLKIGFEDVQTPCQTEGPMHVLKEPHK